MEGAEMSDTPEIDAAELYYDGPTCTHYDYLTRTTSVPWPKRYPHGYKPKPLPTEN